MWCVNEKSINAHVCTGVWARKSKYVCLSVGESVQIEDLSLAFPDLS